jgi:hypothetical protein
VAPSEAGENLDARAAYTMGLASDVVPAAAVKRSRFICALESDERAETVICRPRLASVTFCSVIARTDTICRPPVVEGAAGLPPGAGNVNGSGMSMRLSETATSASSMRRDHSGFSSLLPYRLNQ